jgi:IS605 OrfB family transposase
MKLVVNLKLLPSPYQHRALLQTLEQGNAGANFASSIAWENQTFGQFKLHKLVYRDIREQFSLTAQLAVRVISKVSDGYKLDRKTQRAFQPHGSIAYDDRILRYLPDDRVSIWTLKGRQTIPYACGSKQRELLAHRKGETDLVYRDNTFYLNTVVDVEEPPLLETEDVLGIDLGIVNILADSDGETYSGGQVNGLRKRHSKLRANLQSKGTKSCKRLLKRRSRKEKRFARDTNHRISKRVVLKAERTNRAIALEDLQGIRSRVRVRKNQRRQHHSWAFFQLRSFIQYKARLAGVPVILVDPWNTSRTCPACGLVDKANRVSQSLFSCIQCAFAGPADTIAAENIRVLGRAAVNRPDVAHQDAPVCSHKPPALAGGC